MIMIDNQNLSKVLSKLGAKPCSGLQGRKCFRPRSGNERLCKECHRDKMRAWRLKKKENRSQVVDGYDFNQENYL